MGWEIREVQNERDLKRFVRFPLQLYRNYPYFVPPLISDEIEIFSPSKNPAYENCETKLFMVYYNNSCV